MEFRTILRKCINNFLMIQAGITLAIGIISCIQPPQMGVNRFMFFMPFIYAFFCTLPSLVVYTKKELSLKQMVIRKIIQFVLIELIVFLISYVMGPLRDIFMSVAIIVAVAVVYATVNCLDYLIAKSDTKAMTKKLLQLKERKRG